MAIRYEKDYLLRLMQNFFMALDRIINARKNQDYEAVYSELEVTFMAFFERNLSFFDALTPEETISFFKDDPYPTEKVEMVAMLLFEAGVVDPEFEIKSKRLTKVNTLIIYISEQRKSVSLDHLNKQQYIKKVLDNSCE
jgi:hypothetical protein